MKKERVMVGIILLFFSTCLVPATVQCHEALPSASRGSWLYVGGSGSGNYTKIQDAIGNASEGDTVFVFDESSPYVENIVIDVSITLLGEDKETTIINGSTNTSGENFTDYIGVWITTDNVTVRGFTIQGCNLSGIYIIANHTNISDTILSDNEYYGIVMGSNNSIQPFEMMVHDNMITNNLILRNMIGIFVSGQNNLIRENVISQKIMGIVVMFSISNNISHNIITKEASAGVYISGSYNTVLYRNNISYNGEGVYAMMTSADKILQNNFIKNNKSAESNQLIFNLFYYKYKGEIPYPIRRNVWNGNYWDRPRSFPYKSPGFLRFFVDWHPAQEPYDIPDIRDA
ncbi:MAG TPA: NosD domain-containing protein [Candidatus Thermoplasmatota archaeon]|nr:NosD domain-containing protein [Candidatus Thermoplasmatota archaeon]